jgi:hypothetical protein
VGAGNLFFVSDRRHKEIVLIRNGTDTGCGSGGGGSGRGRIYPEA